MERVVVIGNSGGGKSVLARKLAARFALPYVEIDSILFKPGWQLAPAEEYRAAHARLIAGDRWVLDGMGSLESIPTRLARSSHIVVIDMPLWMHFWLAAERQIAWAKGELKDPPAASSQMAPTGALFRMIWEIDRDWMPEIRRWADEEERRGKRVFRLISVSELGTFVSRV